MKIKTIIVDDEPLAVEILEAYVQKIPELELVATCNNAIEANQILAKHKIELMFLDIEMPVMRGTDFLKTLDDAPKVIFTTAYPEFAVEGFELNALDYLLKPISFERFVKSVNKAIKSFDQTTEPAKVVEGKPEFIFVKADKRLVKVNFDEILFVEGLKDYVIIRTEQNKIITLQTMKSLEEKLPTQTFLRIHRSYIINLDRIHALATGSVEILEKGQIKNIPVGANYKEVLETIIHSKKL
ncbi:MAG: response regulator transcription factor [Saprospiraceae bacterium]|nr:response regulator transcription factor [Saprospiraceae bacterium]